MSLFNVVRFSDAYNGQLSGNSDRKKKEKKSADRHLYVRVAFASQKKEYKFYIENMPTKKLFFKHLSGRCFQNRKELERKLACKEVKRGQHCQTCLQQLLQLLHTICWSWFPVNAFCVEAMHLHILQQLLHDNGDWISLTGQRTHTYSKVTWFCILFILELMQIEHCECLFPKLENSIISRYD